MSDVNSTPKVRSWWRVLLLVAAALVMIVLLAIAVLKPMVDHDIAYDCLWMETVTAWNDANANGLRDAEEAPLAGVRIVVDDVKNQFQDVAHGISDATGAAPLSVFIAGCLEIAMQIYAEAPVGFCLTTPNRVDDKDSKLVAFGLVAC